jgi:hypothetical protein
MKKRWLLLSVLGLLAGLCLYCSESQSPEPNGGGTEFKIEIESYTGSFDDESSQVAISKVTCSNASNGASVRGLDFAGEWISVPVNVPESGTYVAYLQYNAEIDASVTLKLEMPGCAGETVAEFVADDGRGTG